MHAMVAILLWTTRRTMYGLSPWGVVGKKGWRKTSKAEDKVIMTKFHKIRPPGHYVDSRKLRKALPSQLRKKIGRRTIIRRLAEKKLTPQMKVNKQDPGPKLAMRRMTFVQRHAKRTGERWKGYLQGVGDVKEYTYYPKELMPRFKQVRSPWTYMHPSEKYKPAFTRPKRWFKRSDYKKTRKQKVFGLTTSTGKILALLLPKPFNNMIWSRLLREKVYPFLKKEFPDRKTYRILLDGEKIFRAPPCKAVMQKKGIVLLEDWPPHSPEINPKENVWPISEKILRDLEKDSDTFATFQLNCLKAVKAYEKNSGAKKLVASMAKRMQEVIDNNGNMISR